MDKTYSAAFELILDYLEENANCDSRIVEYRTPEALRQVLSLAIEDEGTGMEAIPDLLESYLKYSVRTGHRQFFNQFFAGFNPPAFLGEVFAALSNASMYTYEIAPVATLMEQELIRIMADLAGFRGGNGILTTGGSNANAIALLTARNLAFPETKSEGMSGVGRLVAFISDQAHYSFLKAVNLVGLGENNLIEIPTDAQGCMRPELLEAAIVEHKEKGHHPFFIAATTGTTVRGAFDPIHPLAASARRHGLWLHVDGALGGSMLLSRRHRHLLDGSELADSMTWDPHKLMGIPLVCSALLMKNPDHLERSCGCDGGHYLFHPSDDYDASLDLGRVSMQCGRRVDALKLWLAWKCYGHRGYEARINRLFDLTAYALEAIQGHPSLEVTAPVQSVTLCFRYVPAGDNDSEAFNLELRKRLIQRGLSLVNYAHVDGRMTFRLVFANADMHETDFDRFLEQFVAIGREIDGESASREA
ncbi:MAG: glutamate decarboxylase [Magnetococcales bacterium]|nr:glutamate decarboxylase [Magnetococcales bacterium]